MAAPNLDQIDTILRLVDREVWIVTSAAAGNRGGLTATWVAPASIDAQRPVLLVGIAPNHFTAELIEESHAFVAHLLRVDQTSLAFDFARDSGRQRDKLTGLEFASAVTGVPVLRDCLAWLDCRVFAQYDAGDRLFYWADVVAAAKVSSGPPLKEQAFFGGLAPEAKQALICGRELDLEIQRPLHAAWRSALDKPRPP
jgi:flavin reductase (DIM6/NTAB) family NADH-FMN oxidoreductase RutF